LKNTTASYLNKILEPIREYFEKHKDSYDKMTQLGVITR